MYYNILVTVGHFFEIDVIIDDSFPILTILFSDSENDEILINCDDDFNFFVDESHVSKLFVKFIQNESTETGVLQPIRKRLHRKTSDDQQCKKLRAQMENIELSSSGSSLSDLEIISSDSLLTATSSSSSSNNEEEVSKIEDKKAGDNDVTMKIESNSSKVNETTEQNKTKIIHVEYLPNVYRKKRTESIKDVVIIEGNNTKKVSNEDDDFDFPNALVAVEQTDSQQPSTSTLTRSNSTSSQNKIIISDSSSDEEGQSDSNKKQKSPNFSHTSAYAFAGNNCNGQPQFTTSFFNNCSNQFTRKQSRRQKQQDKYNKRAQHSYDKAENAYFKAQQRSEDYQRMQRERAQEQQIRSQEYVRRAQEQASRFSQRMSPYHQGFIENIHDTVQQTLHTTRNTLFRVADINQKVFNNYNY